MATDDSRMAVSWQNGSDVLPSEKFVQAGTSGFIATITLATKFMSQDMSLCLTPFGLSK